MKVQLIMTFFAAQPLDKGKVTNAQQVVVFVNTSKNTISITVINSFTAFMCYLVKIFQFYSFIVLWPPVILYNNKYCNCKGMRENIGNPTVGTSRILENFENPATVSPTTLQCYIAAYKICKCTVQFLLPVKLLQTRSLRIVRPDVYKRACSVLGHYVRC